MPRWILLVACVGACSANDEILRRNETLYHAIARRDLDTLREVTAPDFHFETANGQRGDRAAWLAGVAALPATVQSITNDELRLHRDGDHAELCGVQLAVVIVDGKTITDRVAFCDRWERRNGRWVVAFAGPS